MPEDPGKRLTLTLFQRLCSGSDDERYGVLEKLDKLAPELDYPTLRQLLLDALEKDYAPTERERTIRGEVDRDQRAMSRRFLVGALARVCNDDPAASTAVRSHLKPKYEPNRWVRYEALAGLAISKAKDLKQIARQIQKTDKEPWPYMLAVAILASLGDREAMDEMHRKFDEESWQVSTLRALRTVPIVELTDDVVEIVSSIGTGRFSDGVTYDAIVALGRIARSPSEKQTAAEALLTALKFCRKHPWYDGHWRQTLKALGNLRLPTTASWLLPDLIAGTPNIVQEAGLTVEKALGAAAAVSLLVGASSSEGDVNLNSYAKSLRYISDQERVFAQLEEMAASGTPENRQTARGLLRALAGPRELSTSAQPRLLRAFQDDHPSYDRNVFVIMSFDPQLRETWSAIQVYLDASGYTALRADMKTYGDERQLWDSLVTYMHGCKYGIAILEDRSANEFNPNVALEYGFMRALGKQVLLLKDRKFEKIRADILGSVWIGFDISDVEVSIKSAIGQWLTDIR